MAYNVYIFIQNNINVLARLYGVYIPIYLHVQSDVYNMIHMQHIRQRVSRGNIHPSHYIDLFYGRNRFYFREVIVLSPQSTVLCEI